MLFPPPFTSRCNSFEIKSNLALVNQVSLQHVLVSELMADLGSNPFKDTPSSGSTPRIPQGPDPLYLHTGTVTAAHRPSMIRIPSSDLATPIKAEFVTAAGLAKMNSSPAAQQSFNEPSRDIFHLDVAIPQQIKIDARSIFPADK